MEFFQANWFWILLGVGAVWFLFRRGGMGCGMGEHGSPGSHASRKTVGRDDSHNGQGAGGPAGRETETTVPRRHRGC